MTVICGPFQQHYRLPKLKRRAAYIPPGLHTGIMELKNSSRSRSVPNERVRVVRLRRARLQGPLDPSKHMLQEELVLLAVRTVSRLREGDSRRRTCHVSIQCPRLV